MDSQQQVAAESIAGAPQPEAVQVPPRRFVYRDLNGDVVQSRPGAVWMQCLDYGPGYTQW